MKKPCCRSIPRCAGCPVRAAAAAARRQRELGATAALVTEILSGRPAPPLPLSVTAALEQLRAARRPEPAGVWISSRCG